MALDLCKKIKDIMDVLNSDAGKTGLTSATGEKIHMYRSIFYLPSFHLLVTNIFRLLTDIHHHLEEIRKKHPVQKLITSATEVSVWKDYECKLDSLWKLLTVRFSPFSCREFLGIKVIGHYRWSWRCRHMTKFKEIKKIIRKFIKLY